MGKNYFDAAYSASQKGDLQQKGSGSQFFDAEARLVEATIQYFDAA